ncbi:MAG: hypothetical protein AAB225_20315 [Acidobacteriota bacterium]
MPRSRVSLLAYLLLVFLSGVVVGLVGHRLYTAREVRATRRPASPEEYRQRYIEDMRTRLKLTDEQVRKVDAILDETRDRFRAEFKTIQDDQRQKIDAVLTPEQSAEYDKMQKEREERRKRGPRPHKGR